MRIEQFLHRLQKAKKTSDGHMACCPAHDDRIPSLSITEGSDGRILLKCFSGCSVEQIVSSLGLVLSDLFPDANGYPRGTEGPKKKPAVTQPTGEIVKIYPYVDEAGRVLYEKVRYEPKDFRWRRADGNGGYTYSLNGLRQVPYNLPEILTASQSEEREIWFTEGEKDCDSIRYLIDHQGEAERGFAVTDVKNLDSWDQQTLELLRNSRVVIWCDHDNAGRNLADKAARTLSSLAKKVSVIDLFEGDDAEGGEGKDISDWIEKALKTTTGDTLPHDEVFEELKRIADASSEWKSALVTVHGRPTLDIEYLSDIESKKIEWIWEPLIPKAFFTLLDGIEGIGKTFMMLDLAKRLTTGMPMPTGGNPHPLSKVLFLSAEDSAEYVLKPRFEQMGGDCNLLGVLRGFFVFTEDGLNRLEATIEQEGFSFILIDPIFSFTRNIDINNGGDVRGVTDRLNQIAATHDVAIIGIRHINKSKGYGDSRSAGSHSIAWLQGSRSALIVGHDVENKNKRGIAQQKLNVGPESHKVIGYEISEDGTFEWLGETDLTIGEMLANKQNSTLEDRTALTEAKLFLESFLADGYRLKRDVDDEARGLGISSSSLNRAKAKLGIKPQKLFEGWMWELPKPTLD